MIARLVAAALVLLGIGAYAATLLGMTVAYHEPATPAAAPAITAPAITAPAAVTPAADEPRRIDAIPNVQTVVDTDSYLAADADAAYLADLLGPDVDVTAEQAVDLTEQARRIAAALTHPEDVPAGAQVPTRESILVSLTTPGATPNGGAYTADEAGKIIDCALAAYAY